MNSSSEKVSMHCLGIDTAKASFDAAFAGKWLAGTGAAAASLPTGHFKRTPEGAAQLVDWLAGQVPHGAPVRVVMEATGRYSQELAQWMVAADVRLKPVIVNPHGAKKYRESLELRNNTDKLAARSLALYGLDRQPEPQQPMSPARQELRELSRWRDYLVGERVALGNRLKETAISAFVRKSEERNHERLVKEITLVEKRIKKHIEAHKELQGDYDLLTSIPGVGFVTALVILGELGDLRRFHKARQLSAFAGLSPEHNESGTSVRKRVRLSNKGNRRARQSLYLAALSAIRTNGPFHKNYLEMLLNGKAKMAAIGAIMRKLLVLMRAILISGKNYDKDKSKVKNHVD